MVSTLLLGMGDKATMKRRRISARNPVIHGLMYQSMMAKATPLSWLCRCERYFHVRAGPLGDLVNLKNDNRSVDEYACEFHWLLARVPRMQREDQIETFVAGLCRALGADVRRERPHDLAKPIRAAREAKVRKEVWIIEAVQS
ncbi:hypothetical protein GUJ93_ZPchr0008g12197 [Zizania palustris]|uniref:Retrotransposon gag domain-containing protein n=1 Tax=Zizania palustris TaxID=103762 RepID=A0A8J5RPF2_ZIZPA|nr:hypothetical protein GUJ93_ZPchr0008g12197 [Zizania palustris]